VKEETLTYFKALFQHFSGWTDEEGELPSDETSTSRDWNPGYPKYEIGFSTICLIIECNSGVKDLQLYSLFNFMENRF
jgi:hypothetical protein